MSAYTQAASVSMPLPEDILKCKWAGDLEAADRAIALRLTQELPAALRDRLLCERERLRRLPTQYPWNRAEALEKLRELVPDLTDAEFARLEDEGLVDFIYLNGERRYFVRFHRTLIKYPALANRNGERRVTPESPWLDPMIAEIKAKGRIARRVTLEAAVYPTEKAFTPGEYRAWLPVPRPCAQQRDIVIETDADSIAPADAPARTAFWRRELTTNTPFTARYSYTSEIVYADPLHAPAPASPLYPNARPVSPEDLAEDSNFVRFTPYLKALAAELSAGAATPVEKAWRFYEFITTKVRYAFVRDYFQIDSLGEYCAVNLKGDCGLQALLFILLCRISGIPARWQSGLSVEREGGGSHDWTQFWLEGWGWLFCDPSYGGGAWRNGSAERHAYYFGNIDPCRMAANNAFQAPLWPEEDFLRYDPYDNQDGELCLTGRAFPFTGRELDGHARLVSLEAL